MIRKAHTSCAATFKSMMHKFLDCFVGGYLLYSSGEGQYYRCSGIALSLLIEVLGLAAAGLELAVWFEVTLWRVALLPFVSPSASQSFI